jgi:hypothetical protein
MHDGTKRLFLLTVRQHLNQNFGGEWIGFANPVYWPTLFSDVSPVDFCLYLKPIGDLRGIETTSS